MGAVYNVGVVKTKRNINRDLDSLSTSRFSLLLIIIIQQPLSHILNKPTNKHLSIPYQSPAKMRFELTSIILALGFLGTANAYTACYATEATCEQQCGEGCGYHPGIVTDLGEFSLRPSLTLGRSWGGRETSLLISRCRLLLHRLSGAGRSTEASRVSFVPTGKFVYIAPTSLPAWVIRRMIWLIDLVLIAGSRGQ